MTLPSAELPPELYVVSINDVSEVGAFGDALIARFMGPAWGPPGDDRTQVGRMLAPWTLLSENNRVHTSQGIKAKRHED